MYCSNSHFIPLLYAFQHSFKSRFQEATPCCLPHLALLLRSQVPGPPRPSPALHGGLGRFLWTLQVASSVPRAPVTIPGDTPLALGSFLSTRWQKLPTGHRRLDILNEIVLRPNPPASILPDLVPPVTEATYSGPLLTNPSSSQWVPLSSFHPSPPLPPLSVATFFRPKQSLTWDSVTASELDSRFYLSSQRFLSRVQGLQHYHIFIFINIRLKFSISMSHEH